MIRFIDLFAGIGGIRLGFENACRELNIKSECILSSEIDSKARETYQLNYGHLPSGDIKQITEFEEFDFLLAGFPCQAFSYAGKQLGFADTRGTLFFEVERILAKYKPKGFILENVRGLTTHDKGRTFKVIIQHLVDLGYKVEYRLLNSSNFGVPQNRVRVYIVGLLDETPKLTIQSDLGAADSHKYKTNGVNKSLFGEHQSVAVKEILEDSVDEKYHCTKDFVSRLLDFVKNKPNKLHGVRLIDYRNGNSIHSWELGIRGVCSSDEIAFMNALVANRRRKEFGTHQDGKRLSLEEIRTFFDHPNLLQIVQSLIQKKYIKEVEGRFNPVAGNMSFEVFKFLDPESISITLVTSDAHKLGIVHNGVIRRITPRECARLQGFPDSFVLNPSDTAAYRQFGNSVSVPVVQAVAYDLLRGSKLCG